MRRAFINSMSWLLLNPGHVNCVIRLKLFINKHEDFSVMMRYHMYVMNVNAAQDDAFASHMNA